MPSSYLRIAGRDRPWGRLHVRAAGAASQKGRGRRRARGGGGEEMGGAATGELGKGMGWSGHQRSRRLLG
jgi:hypothetical protein